MPRPYIVVAGHVCLDVIPTFGEDAAATQALFRPGTLTEVGPPVLATGGAVSNVGLALHRLGVDVRLVGKIGGDLFGRAILDILGARGARLAGQMIVDAEATTSYTVVLSPPGVDRVFLHSPGANDAFHPSEINPGIVDGARVLHFGYPPLMADTFADGGAALVELFGEVRRRGTAVSLDMAQVDPESRAGRADWPAFLRTVLPEVDIFGPSLGEILYMLGRDADRPPSAARIVQIADELLAMGPAVVALKLGKSGLLLRTIGDAGRLADVPGLHLGDEWADRTLLHGCFEVAAAGTTGAGDCTLAGLLASLLDGRGPEAVLRDACAVGACSVEREDATSGVPSWEAVQSRLRAGWPQRRVEVRLEGWTWSDEHGLWCVTTD